MSEELGRVLVTGANGHLGRRLLARLSGERPLRAVVRSERAAARIEAENLQPDGLDLRTLDYGDAEALTAAAEGCTHAVHLVGILKEGSTSSYVQAHEDTSRALAQAAEARGLRRIVTLSILGSHPDASNACLASKGRGERILLDAKTPALVLRVPMVLGEDDFASRALAARARSGTVFMTRGGASLEQPIYAGDVVEALVAGVTREGLDDVALDLAGPESLPARELVRRAAALLDGAPRILPTPRALVFTAAALLEKLSKDPPVTRAMLGVLDHDDAVDPGAAARRLGIELTPLDETLRRCVGPESQ